MAQDSKIEWTTHTFNPWRGCTKVSDGCKHCYAETLSGRNPRSLGVWGQRGTRVVASESMWREPLKWNRLAGEVGERHRVFCASLADVFEGPDTMPAADWPKIVEARKRLFDLICRTPNLDWLLLTKRPENALQMMVDAGLYAVANPSLPCPQPNLWIGTSVEDARVKNRIDLLRSVPAAIRFLSIEPLIGDVGRIDLASINLVIVGGESGPGARPMNPAWARSLRDQCQAVGVLFFFKQWGECLPADQVRDVVALPINLCHMERYPSEPPCSGFRVGKKSAGRLLDGREWNDMPNVLATASRPR